MITRFFRSVKFPSVRHLDGASPLGRRFDLILGIEASVDPESGMTVNLVHVDAWLSELKRQDQFQEHKTAFELIERLRVQLEPRVFDKNAILCSLQLRDGHQLFEWQETRWKYHRTTTENITDEQGIDWPVAVTRTWDSITIPAEEPASAILPWLPTETVWEDPFSTRKFVRNDKKI